MVSIITRADYIRNISSDKYTTALINFLFRKAVVVDSGVTASNANDASIFVLRAIQTNDEKLFSEIYEHISLRKPKPTSDWIYNEILLFSLTLGIYKFAFAHQWFQDVLKLRLAHSHGENRLVAQTYVDLLTGNLDSRNNFQPLMLVLKYYLNLPIGDEDLVNSVYDDLVYKPYPQHKSPFLNIISLRAYDIIILSKGLEDRKKQIKILEFVDVFTKRAYQFALALWILLVLIMLAASIAFLNFYLTVSSQLTEKLDKILTFLPFLGFTGLVVPVFRYKEKIIDIFKKPFLAFFGFGLDQN